MIHRLGIDALRVLPVVYPGAGNFLCVKHVATDDERARNRIFNVVFQYLSNAIDTSVIL